MRKHLAIITLSMLGVSIDAPAAETTKPFQTQPTEVVRLGHVLIEEKRGAVCSAP